MGYALPRRKNESVRVGLAVRDTQPVLNDQFDLEVDASGFAVGAVLLQKKEDGKRHPVGYYSATLNEAPNATTTSTIWSS
jgi:hypothetical protein